MPKHCTSGPSSKNPKLFQGPCVCRPPWFFSLSYSPRVLATRKLENDAKGKTVSVSFLQRWYATAPSPTPLSLFISMRELRGFSCSHLCVWVRTFFSSFLSFFLFMFLLTLETRHKARRRRTEESRSRACVCIDLHTSVFLLWDLFFYLLVFLNISEFPQSLTVLLCFRVFRANQF